MGSKGNRRSRVRYRVGRESLLLKPIAEQEEAVKEVCRVVLISTPMEQWTRDPGMERDLQSVETVEASEEDRVSVELGELKARAQRLSEQLAQLSSEEVILEPGKKESTERRESSKLLTEEKPGIDSVPRFDRSMDSETPDLPSEYDDIVEKPNQIQTDPAPELATSSTKSVKAKKSITFLLPVAPCVSPTQSCQDTTTIPDDKGTDIKVSGIIDSGVSKAEVSDPEISDLGCGSKWQHRQKEVFVYPDLTVPASGYRSRLPGSRYYWQMPFRHKLFEELSWPSVAGDSDLEDEETASIPPSQTKQEEVDPMVLAPSGDVYSYFQRRRVSPCSYTHPVNSDLTRRLSGRGAWIY